MINLFSRIENLPGHIGLARLGLIISTVLLTLFGLVMIYSASSIASLSNFDVPTYYFTKQLVYIAVGCIFILLALKIPFEWYTSTPVLWVFWAITLLMLIYVEFKGHSTNGAQRWVRVAGFTLQPSEFAKITQLLMLACLLERFAHDVAERLKTLGILAIVVGLPMVLIVAQPDLGTTIILGMNLLILMIIAGVPRKLIVVLAVLMVVGATVLILFQPFRFARLLTVFNPWADPQGKGYQTIQGLYAFGSGGLFGVGIGESHQKFLYLPEAHTDFIFAIIGEECGLIGAICVLALFTLFIVSGLHIANQTDLLFSRLVALGATTLIGIQALINIMCVIGLFPITGKPLPFLSYGGSSIISTLILVGLLLAVSRQTEGAVLARRVKDERASSRSEKTRGQFRLLGNQNTGEMSASTLGVPAQPRTRRSSRSIRGFRDSSGVADRGAPRSSTRAGSARQGSRSDGSRSKGLLLPGKSARKKIMREPRATIRKRGERP